MPSSGIIKNALGNAEFTDLRSHIVKHFVKLSNRDARTLTLYTGHVGEATIVKFWSYSNYAGKITWKLTMLSNSYKSFKFTIKMRDMFRVLRKTNLLRTSAAIPIL